MEEEDFEGDNLAKLVVTRIGDHSTDLTVNYLVSGTAKKTDYRPLSGSVLIPAGDITADIQIQAVEDNEIEGDEHVIVHISDSTLYNSHPKNVAAVLIQDSLPVVTLTLNGADETAEGGSATTATLTRNDRGGDEIVVNLSITGTANNQSDYVSIANQVRMPKGSRTVNIELQAIDDTVNETQEDIVLKVLPGEGYSGGAEMQTRVVIPENDEKNLPEVEFTLTSSEELESVGYATVSYTHLTLPTIYSV